MTRMVEPSMKAGQHGYVLLFVTAALTVVAMVAAQLAFRVEALRSQAVTMQQQAEATIQTESAKAMVLYWLSTRPVGLAAAGFADEQPLVLDGRLYRTDQGVLVRVQDERGLLSVNVLDRERFGNLLVQAGASTSEAAGMLDVLEDYADSDSLRRLNGAEAPDYREQGLPPPRNDWILSVDELARMPIWQHNNAIRTDIGAWLGVRRDKLFNPNSAPIELLRRMWPSVRADQWSLFETLRRRAPFLDAATATAATGIDFGGEQLLFHASNALRVQIWAPGLSQADEYNLLILPTGNAAPWLIHEVRQSDRLMAPKDDITLVAKFPVPSQAFNQSRALAQPAP